MYGLSFPKPLDKERQLAKAYSIDLRERVLKSLEKHTHKVVSELFGVSTRTIYRWSKQKKETGSLEPLKREFAYKKIDYEKLKKYTEEHPDQFLSEIAEHFSVTLQAIFYAFKKLKITRKKRQVSIKKGKKKKEKLFLKS